MPTNLPPEYYKIEEQMRSARSKQEKISYLEELLRVVPKHKGTEKLRGDLKRRLSKLKETAKPARSGRVHVSPYSIQKEGAGQVVLIGPPNSGKSSLLKSLSKAEPPVEDFPFSSVTPLAGMMPVFNIQIQLIDTPPLTRNYIDPEFFSLLRRAELMVWVVDIQGPTLEQLEELQQILDEQRIRPDLGQEPGPEDPKTISKPLLVAVNKIDDRHLEGDFQALEELLDAQWPLLPLSSSRAELLEDFKSSVFKALRIVRVYSKAPGKEADLSHPHVLSRGSTLEDFAAQVHKDFTRSLRFARVWGGGVYDGQMAGRDYVLQDEDIVELKL